MRSPGPRSVAGALILSWLIPGGGQLYLGERRKGRRMMALYLAVAIPSLVVLLAWGPLPALIGGLAALPVWVWNQRDIRRTLGVPWRPLLPTYRQTFDAIRGRDRFYPDDPLVSAPERPE